MPGSFQPVNLEAGFDDWAEIRLDPSVGLLGAAAGVDVVEGRLLVSLPGGTTAEEFMDQLAGALRHLRVQEATMRYDWIERRCIEFADMIFHPRYNAPRAFAHDFRESVLVTDLYAIDPAEQAWRLFWLVISARAASTEGRSLWR